MTDEQTFTILVVDDEPPICDLLARTGKKVFPEAVFINTRSAQETLDYVSQQPDNAPQLVLLDIELGTVVNGLDLLPELHKRFAGTVPIIMFTAHNEQPRVRQSYDKGAVAFTSKPDDMEGWTEYVLRLKKYWYETTQLPGHTTSFE